MIRRLAIALFSISLFAAPTVAGGPPRHTPVKMYAHYNRGARWFNANVPWHGPYAHPSWGQPMALAAPPNAGMQTSYSWGVARTRMVPNYHQFTRPYVAPGGGAGSLSAAPNWPSSTTHQGVYYVRGPW